MLHSLDRFLEFGDILDDPEQGFRVLILVKFEDRLDLDMAKLASSDAW